MIVEQFVPAFHYGDAIGNSTYRFHQFLENRGIESRIVGMTIDKSMEDKAVFFKDYKENPDSIKILHFAVPSELTDFFLKAKGKKVIFYHNITPPNFFVDFSEELVRFTRAGRDHLERLSDCFELAVADSGYNAGELEELKYRNVHTFPIMIDLTEYEKSHSEGFFRLLKNERKNLIFVGRVTPNKKIEDLVKLTFYYKKYLSPSIRMIIAGNPETLPKYYLAVKDLAARFLLKTDDFFFTGHIPFTELLSVYRLADAFVSMSEHEGFCLPLIESCFFRVPVLAYNSGAVAETLGEGGIILNDKQVEKAAGLAERLVEDRNLRETIQKNQAERIEEYRRESDPELLLAMLREL